jgi:luciferase family oxidoreductase group 1
MTLALSILDQSTVASGRTPAEAIRETLALAQLADRWGYRRYWLAEHHNSASHAGTAPEILISAIAAVTQRIRVGSAGVMLPHYSALKVAEQFKVLEAIAPGRIDLGVGRAPGSDGRTAYALNPNAAEAADRFPQQVQELLGWLGDALPANHPFAQVAAQPAIPTRPEVWVLGSSDFGAQLAAYFGLPYCFAHFITDGRGSEEAMALYRDGMRRWRCLPSQRLPRRRRCGCTSRARSGGCRATAGSIRRCPRWRRRRPMSCRRPSGRSWSGSGSAPSWGRRSRCWRSSPPWRRRMGCRRWRC